MHVLITGAAGFVGRALAARLQTEGRLRGRALTRLSLVDPGFAGQAPGDGPVRRLAADLADDEARARALGPGPVDLVFHLASIPGGQAEAEPDLARWVNLDLTMALLDHARHQVTAGGPAPVFVFASSIAVFGDLGAAVDDDTPTRPRLSYGAHKLVGEVLLDDASRRGWVDGRGLRLPGVLARPPARTGQLSAFLSDMIRELSAGRPFVCPMSAEAVTWASSRAAVVEQLRHAAELPAGALGARRSLTVPAVRFTMADLVSAIGRVHGTAAAERVRYEPQPTLEALFGRYPPLHATAAQAAGFRTDADLDTLVRQALDPA